MICYFICIYIHMYHASNYIIKSGQDMGGEEEEEKYA
jgi:hypothetical protein